MFAAADVTGQSCFASPLFQKHRFSSVRSQCSASDSAAPAPPLCLPLLMFPPSKWASCGQAHTTRSPSPLFLAWELIPGVQTRGKTRGTSQQRAGQQLQPGGMKPGGAWLISLPSNGASLLWQERAGSANRGGEAFLAQEPVSGWMESPYVLQSLGRSTGRLHMGAAGTAGHRVGRDKKRHQHWGCPNPAGHSQGNSQTKHTKKSVALAVNTVEPIFAPFTYFVHT